MTLEVPPARRGSVPPEFAPQPAPPARHSRARRMVPPAVLGGGLAALTLALHLRDPHEQGSWGLCPFAALGINCPGCGGLRAVNDLTDLRVADAASSNLLFFVAVPFVLYVLARWSWGRWTGRPWQMSDRAMNVAAGVVLVSLVVFTALRNTGTFAWLAP